MAPRKWHNVFIQCQDDDDVRARHCSTWHTPAGGHDDDLRVDEKCVLGGAACASCESCYKRIMLSDI